MIPVCYPVLAVFAASLCGAAAAGETVTYTYDALGRVIQVERAGTVNDGVESAYAYDDADNRTQLTVTGAPLAHSVPVRGAAPLPLTEAGPPEPQQAAAVAATDD